MRAAYPTFLLAQKLSKYFLYVRKEYDVSRESGLGEYNSMNIWQYLVWHFTNANFIRSYEVIFRNDLIPASQLIVVQRAAHCGANIAWYLYHRSPSETRQLAVLTVECGRCSPWGVA